MRGKIKDFTLGLDRRQFISFELTGENRPEYDKLKDCADLDIEVKKHREKRSLDANAYMWVLLDKIAQVILSDKDSVYLDMLGKYGVFTHVICKPSAVDAFKAQYRLCKDIGDVTVNGTEGRQIQCYFGSSTYDTKQMARLIDGVILEAKELDIETLTPDQLERMKDEWGRK